MEKIHCLVLHCLENDCRSHSGNKSKSGCCTLANFLAHDNEFHLQFIWIFDVYKWKFINEFYESAAELIGLCIIIACARTFRAFLPSKTHFESIKRNYTA